MVEVHYIDPKTHETHTLNKILSHNLLEEINILSSDLPMNCFECDVIPNVTFTEGGTLEVYSNNKFYGTFYISSIERISQVAYRLLSYNSIYILDNVYYDYWTAFVTTLWENEIESGGVYGFDTFGILGALEILSGIKFPSPEDEAPTIDLSEYAVYGYMPSSSARVILCNLAFSCGLMVDSSRSAGIDLKPIPKVLSSTINSNRIIGNATVSKNSAITGAALKKYSAYSENSDNVICVQVKYGQKTKVNFEKPSIIASVYTVTIGPDGEEIKTDISDKIIDGSTTDENGMPVNDYTYCLNYYEFTVDDEEITQVYFSLIQFEFSTEEFEITNTESPNTAKSNILKLNDFLLDGVTLNGSKKIDKISDIKKYISSRRTANAKIILENEKVGDLVKIETAYDGYFTGIITTMNISFGYKDVADIEVLEWGALLSEPLTDENDEIITDINNDTIYVYVTGGNENATI